jgi:hypothetical protein
LPAAAAGPADAAQTAAKPTVSVLAGGLNTPKYMTFGPHGSLYVAESGAVGCQCVALVGTTGAPTKACTGDTGSVDRIDQSGRVTTVLHGLASTTEQDNEGRSRSRSPASTRSPDARAVQRPDRRVIGPWPPA